MKDNRKMLIAGCLGLALAFFGWTPRADACYMSPALSAAADSFSAFLSDFNRWDAHLDYQPLLVLAATPDQDRLNTVLELWWLWANGYGRSSNANDTGTSSLDSSSPFFSPTFSPEEQPSAGSGGNGVTLLPPLGSYSPPTPPIGIIIGGSPGNPPTGGKGPQPGNIHPDIAQMPEPSTLTLLSCGFAALAGYGWRRRNAQA